MLELELGKIIHGEQKLTLASVRDISERQAHTEALEHLALHDGLTGLANRTLFVNLMARALRTSRRASETRTVLVMDLDGFKHINDTLDHERGDILLKQVGERLTASLRDSDIVARLGGDEFGILPVDCTDLAAAAAVALKVEWACEQVFVLDAQIAHITPSIGIAVFPDHGGTTHRAQRA